MLLPMFRLLNFIYRPLLSCVSERGSVTLSFEAIFMAIMVGVLVVVLGFNSLTQCEMKNSAVWVECGNVLDCQIDRQSCSKITPIDTPPLSGNPSEPCGSQTMKVETMPVGPGEDKYIDIVEPCV